MLRITNKYKELYEIDYLVKEFLSQNLTRTYERTSKQLKDDIILTLSNLKYSWYDINEVIKVIKDETKFNPGIILSTTFGTIIDTHDKESYSIIEKMMNIGDYNNIKILVGATQKLSMRCVNSDKYQVKILYSHNFIKNTCKFYKIYITSMKK